MDTDARPTRDQEQVAVLWALVTRWHVRQSAFPGLELIDHVTDYCRVFRDDTVAQRRPWLRELTLADKRPESWPADASWAKHSEFWRATLMRVAYWQQGLLENPCPGATDWGNVDVGDHPKPNMRLQGCRGMARAFANQFYATGRAM